MTSRELVPYIDWTPFFQTWEFKGRYPPLLDDPEHGAAARQLFDDAQAMLKRIVDERWFTPKAVIGFWPANAIGDDIALYTGESRSEPLATLHTLRQQLAQARRQAQSRARRFRRAEGAAARPIMSAPSSSPPARRKKRLPRATPAPMTIMARSWSRRSPTASPRPSPSACTSACAASSGPMRTDESFAPARADDRTLRRHSPGARLSGAARPHREGDALRPARRRKAHGREADRKLRHDAGRVGQRALLLATRARIISASPRSSAIRSRITRPQGHGRSREVERWLAPILNYEPVAAEAAE